MKDNISENRLVLNEQLTRLKNVNVKNAITKYFRNDSKVKDTPLKFECECSELDCNKHIETSIDTYEKKHKRNDRFMIHKGHETPSIEKVVEEQPNYEVVEKAKLKP